MHMKEQTIELKKHLQLLKDNYEANDPPEDKKDMTFFMHVKSKTEPLYAMLETWETDALEIVKQRKVNVHPHQITSTRENMELLLMHSFYIDVKRKRYMELNHSVLFIFDQLLRDL
ncbi:DUF1798 family protein [Virgibacillus necropolis]|uniref:DUF1798 domain-containing protein n=1 Tax=Virgibacillus necropolis TaxID=163877 RepID=A0A221MD33_9BACI|nr:DUF1798 family protein [Virgibacillus necropolis]ASN05541.1 hypothetical protein CFK40_11225 [Virgibacillus necropolis]